MHRPVQPTRHGPAMTVDAGTARAAADLDTGVKRNGYARRTPQNSGNIAFTMSLMSERNAVG